MAEFFQSQMDAVFCVYGLGFIVMAAIALSISRSDATMPWRLLALFGLIHGTSEWLDMAALIAQETDMSAIRLAAKLASYAVMAEMARRCLDSRRARAVASIISLAALAWCLSEWAKGDLAGADALGRRLIVLPGCVLIALRLARGEREGGSAWLALAGCAFAAYGVLAGLVGPRCDEIDFLPTQEGFLAAFGFPVQALRCAAAIAIAAALWGRRTKMESHAAGGWARFQSVGAVLAALVAGGWLMADRLGNAAAESASREIAVALHSLSAEIEAAQSPAAIAKALDPETFRLVGLAAHLADGDGAIIASSDASAIGRRLWPEPDGEGGAVFPAKPRGGTLAFGGKLTAVGAASLRDGMTLAVSSPLSERAAFRGLGLLLTLLGCAGCIWHFIAVNSHRQANAMEAERAEVFRSLAEGLAEAKVKAEQAERSKALFLAAMSHELRTPLNAICGYASLLAKEAGGDDAAFGGKIGAAASTMVSIIGSLLDFSKIEAGKLELEKAPFRLRDPFAEACDMAAVIASAKGVALAASPGPELEWACGDALRLKQVAINLLSNAVKFTPPGGTVTLAVSAERSGPDVALTLSVKDTGIGIPAARLGRLFQAYSQADAGVARRSGGTGLGLAIARGIADAMGGTLTAESEEGRGTEFVFTAVLPAASAPARPEPSAAKSSAPSLAGLRVLIADDNAMNRDVASRNLRRAGAETVCAGNGAEAVEVAQAGGFAAILMDVRMPVMDGLEATRRLRAGGDRTPIIAMSADADADAAAERAEAGMGHDAPKPVDFARLVSLIAGLAAGQDASPAALREAIGSGDLASASRIAEAMRRSAQGAKNYRLAAAAKFLSGSLADGADAGTLEARLSFVENEVAAGR